MKRRIRINPKTQLAYIPDEIIREGFTDDVDAYANAITVTLVKPNSTLAEIEQSLQIVLRDIRLRMGKIES